MKRITTTILLIIFTTSISYGTVRRYTEYNLSDFRLSICYNNWDFPVNSLLYYKGVSELLNQYVIKKKNENKLQNRKVHIEIGCIMFGGEPSIDMYRDKYSYYVFIHNLPSLQYLARVVDYFAHPNWESFCYDYKKVDYSVARDTFDKRLNETVGYYKNSFFENKIVDVFSLDDLVISYEGDSLITRLNNIVIPFKIGNIYPVHFKNRYILFSHRFLTVYEDNNIVLRYSIPKSSSYEKRHYDYLTRTYSDWLNVYDNNERNPIFSYCYSKNNFYTIKRWANEGQQKEI